jgi:arylsulfatase A-like enzyme
VSRSGRAPLAALLAALAGCDPAGLPETAASAPNVILLVVDTLRADHVHGYGYERETTPTLDAIMSRGVRFDAAIAPSSWSAPSHTTIVTGVQPWRHRVMGWHQRMAPDVQPLASLLDAAGYATGLFSSHYALHVSVGGITAGIDTEFIARNDDDASVLREAGRWARSAGGPYFLYVCLMTPHAPYTKYPPSYDEEFFTDMPPGGGAIFPFVSENWIGRGGIPRSVRLGNHQRLGYYVNRYDRAIRYVDALVGELFDSLQAAGRLDDTIVVITSDHGEALGDKGAFAHEFHLYDFLVRVPLIVSYPSAIEPGRWRGQVSLADIVPTVLGLAGLAAPSELDGSDLSSWLTSGRRPERSPLVTGTYRKSGHDRYMVRTDRYKLIHDAADGREELYDLVADPAETNDLMAAARPPGELGALRSALATLLERHARIDAERIDLPPDADLREKLRALGYLSESAPSAPAREPGLRPTR